MPTVECHVFTDPACRHFREPSTKRERRAHDRARGVSCPTCMRRRSRIRVRASRTGFWWVMVPGHMPQSFPTWDDAMRFARLVWRARHADAS